MDHKRWGGGACGVLKSHIILLQKSNVWEPPITNYVQSMLNYYFLFYAWKIDHPSQTKLYEVDASWSFCYTENNYKGAHKQSPKLITFLGQVHVVKSQLVQFCKSKRCINDPFVNCC